MKNNSSKIKIFAIIIISSFSMFLFSCNKSENISNGKNLYTVKWENYDGTILEIDNDVKKGSYPIFDADIPVKKQNKDTYYTFAGWKPELSKVTSNITYKAIFEEAELEVYDGMVIGEYKKDNSLLNIAIMADPHVPYASRYDKFGFTNEELFKNRIENAINEYGASAILISGDLTANSKSEEYDLYNKTILSYKDKCEFIAASGNHEFRFTEKGTKKRRSQFKNIYAPRWRSKMQKGLYYSYWLGDTHIVALGDNYYDTDIKDSDGKKIGFGRAKGNITSKEIDWLEDIIEKDDERGITTIVLCHWPIGGTNNGSSHKLGYWAIEKSEERLKSIISSHDNAILFSGHTHGKVKEPLPVQVENGGMFVHAGALTSNKPTYVIMKEIETNDSTKKYELKYILPTKESKTFIFTHDVPGGEE